MWIPVLISLMAQQPGAPPVAPTGESRVVVAAPVYHPDGTVNGETATLAASPSVLFVYSRRSVCDTATMAAAEPTDAGFGWRVATSVVRLTTAEVVVSVDWRRRWDRGQAIANGPGGTAQLTLHPGDRIPLDHIPNPTMTEACRAVGLGLEMRLGRTPVPPPPGRVTLPLGAKEGGAGQLDVDLWLVHTQPTGVEQAQHQKIRLTPTGGAFTFSPVRFTTRQGEAGVELNGTFQRYTAGGVEFLLVGMSRTVTGAAAPQSGYSGDTSSFVPLPRADEVLSFEMGSGAAGGRGTGQARVGGGGGGGGGAVAAGGTGGVATGAAGAGGARGGGGMGAGARSGGGGSARGGFGAAAPQEDMARRLEEMANAMRVAAILDGHRFALRVKVTPVPGS